MKKFRYKKKNNSATFFVFSTFLIAISLTIGYSFFSESLILSGSATNPKYVSPNLIPQLAINSGRYITGSYGTNVQWSSETYDGKNNLTVYLNRRNTQTQLRSTTLNVNNLRNVYPLSLTSRNVSYNIVSGNNNFGTITPSTGLASITSNQTTYFRLVLSMRTSNPGRMEVKATYRYTYDGVYKYFYITVVII